jgi:hypothetical protein
MEKGGTGFDCRGKIEAGIESRRREMPLLESDSIRGLEQSTFFSTVIGSIKPIATI